MIERILKDIDNKECYYVGTNGCLYQDLKKEELQEIKHEIERFNYIIRELDNWLKDQQMNSIEIDEWTIIQVRDKLLELKMESK